MTATPVEPLLRVQDLHAGYAGRPVLQGVSLQVQPGEVRVILGGSGCGKTTLLKHLAGLLPPQQGTVTLWGQNFWRASEAGQVALLLRLGMLFQGGALLGSQTALQNVCLPLQEWSMLPPQQIVDIAMMKLAAVGLQDAAGRLPAELSGGMRKRVALARAMALDPQLLLCDEPSAGLDPVTAAELDALLLQLRERFGMTLVVVSHELASIEAIADRVLMLDGGQVIADGPLGEVKRLDDRRLQVFFGRQPRSIEGRSGRSSVFDMLTGTARREP